MTIKVTKEQLDEIVSRSVAKVLQEMQGITIVDDEEKSGQSSNAEPRDAGHFSEEQYQEAMRVMAANRGKGSEPKVGIFWYNIAQQQLFGVVSHKRSDYVRPNAGGGLVTCSEMHEDVWKKEYRKQKYHGNGVGPFKGEYQNKPRGRVFYSPADDQYIIAVGSWYDDHKEVLPLIMEEFDLPEDKTVVQQASHWDIGQTWR